MYAGLSIVNFYALQMPSGFFTADMYTKLFLQVLCVSNIKYKKDLHMVAVFLIIT